MIEFNLPRASVMAISSAVVAVLWGIFEFEDSAPRSEASVAVVPAHITQSLASPIASAASTADAHIATPEAKASAVVDCPGQRLELRRDESFKVHCIARARPVQNGSMRSYRAELESHDGLWLNIDTSDSRVMAVSVGSVAGADFNCEGAGCNGVTLGQADMRGARGIDLDGTVLPATDPTTAGSKRIRLSGRLLTEPDDAQGIPASCLDQNVVITTAQSPPARFCAEDGVGVEWDDAGARVYRFIGLEGPAVTVALDTAGRLARIDHGELGCLAEACAGAVLSDAAPDGERTLILNGTLLRSESAADGWSGLQGRLVLPSAEASTR